MAGESSRLKFEKEEGLGHCAIIEKGVFGLGLSYGACAGRYESISERCECQLKERSVLTLHSSIDVYCSC